MNEPPWFGHWVAAHTARFPGLDWGHCPEELFEGWRHAFLRNKVTRNEADVASYRAMEARVYPDAMLHHLMVSIREARCRVVPDTPAHGHSPRCELCSGTGRAPLPPCDRYPMGSVCACGCAAGRAFHATCPTTPCLADRPDLRERIARDRAAREERGARMLAAVGVDPYGSTEEIARGLALIARRGIGRAAGADREPRPEAQATPIPSSASARGEG